MLHAWLSPAVNSAALRVRSQTLSKGLEGVCVCVWPGRAQCHVEGLRQGIMQNSLRGNDPVAGKRQQSSENLMSDLFEKYGRQLILITARESRAGSQPLCTHRALAAVK